MQSGEEEVQERAEEIRQHPDDHQHGSDPKEVFHQTLACSTLGDELKPELVEAHLEVQPYLYQG